MFFKNRILENFKTSLLLLFTISTAALSQTQKPEIYFEILRGSDKPLLHAGSPDCKTIKYGIEGGTVIQLNGYYHLFTAEMLGEPKFVKMALGYWKSKDGVDWKRIKSIFESDGDFTGTSPRAALWSPMPFFNTKENRWNLFYVGYRSKPNTDSAWFNNYDGRVYRAVAVKPGKKEIGGPYKDKEVVLAPGKDSDQWEGLQGVDSYYIYQVKSEWYAFYGSAKTEFMPCKYWGVGLAKAPSMAGPWRRCSEMNPVDFNINFAENPIVTQLESGLYVALFDRGGPGIGFATSKDGIKWSSCETLFPETKISKWWERMRTPLCLIHEPDGTYTIFFTAFANEGFYGSLGSINVKIFQNK